MAHGKRSIVGRGFGILREVGIGSAAELSHM